MLFVFVLRQMFEFVVGVFSSGDAWICYWCSSFCRCFAFWLVVFCVFGGSDLLFVLVLLGMLDSLLSFLRMRGCDAAVCTSWGALICYWCAFSSRCLDLFLEFVLLGNLGFVVCVRSS